MEEDKLTLAVEEANTKLIEIINEAVLVGYSKAYAKAQVINLIANTTKRSVGQLISIQFLSIYF